jgi:SWI/SNF-related matrix-associated actin-dependent regulator of chromatin subfamily A member 5
VDRAHRIGQKKPVQVFRFITEGTVEEKIIERADRKLFLDAAVIQQGRLAEQHSSLEKDELMKMVRFGADQILSGKGGTYTDEDIDALIAKGEEKTSEIEAKLQTDVKHNLADFKLLADTDDGKDTFSFDGKNYRGEASTAATFINLPQRQRKRNYNEDEYYRTTMKSATSSGMKAHAADSALKKRKRGPVLHDFQLFDSERLNAVVEKERKIAEEKESQIRLISELRARAKQCGSANISEANATNNSEALLQQANELESKLDTFTLSPQEAQLKARLHGEGFPDWNRKDFKSFCAAVERHGRYDFANISRDVTSETGKTEKEIQRYFVAFWTNYRRIQDYKKVIEKIERGEKKILRLRRTRDQIQEKIERHLEDVFGSQFAEIKDGTVPSANELLEHSWYKMKINYGSSSKGRHYQEEEDAFLIAMMYRHGYGAAERIRMSIRRAWQFRFDWYFKSRSAFEIQKRCDFLVKIIERENEDIRKAMEEEDKAPKEVSAWSNEDNTSDAAGDIAIAYASVEAGGVAAAAVPSQSAATASTPVQ